MPAQQVSVKSFIPRSFYKYWEILIGVFLNPGASIVLDLIVVCQLYQQIFMLLLNTEEVVNVLLYWYWLWTVRDYVFVVVHQHCLKTGNDLWLSFAFPLNLQFSVTAITYLPVEAESIQPLILPHKSTIWWLNNTPKLPFIVKHPSGLTNCRKHVIQRSILCVPDMLGCNSWTWRSQILYTANSSLIDAQIHPFITSSFHQTCLTLLSHSMPLTASFNRLPLALLYHIILKLHYPASILARGTVNFTTLHVYPLFFRCSGLFSVSSLLSCPSFIKLHFSELNTGGISAYVTTFKKLWHNFLQCFSFML